LFKNTFGWQGSKLNSWRLEERYREPEVIIENCEAEEDMEDKVEEVAEAREKGIANEEEVEDEQRDDEVMVVEANQENSTEIVDELDFEVISFVEIHFLFLFAFLQGCGSGRIRTFLVVSRSGSYRYFGNVRL